MNARKKRTPRQKAVDKADRAFSDYIRERDGWTCQTYGCRKSRAGGDVMQCGHLFTRKNYSTRWDEDNAKCQCAGCNLRHEYDPSPFTKTFLDKIGKPGWDELYARHHQVKKYKTFEIEEIADFYRNKLREVSK